MLAYTLVSALAGASFVLANPAPAPAQAPAITAAPIFNRRQSESALKLECHAQLASIQARKPEPSDKLEDWMATTNEAKNGNSLGDVLNICYAIYGKEMPDPPSSLQSEWSTYRSAQASYASSIGPAVSSLKAKCPKDMAFDFLFVAMSDMDSCHTAFAAMSLPDSELLTTSPSPSRTVIVAPTTTIGPSEEAGAGGKDTETKEGSAQSTDTSTAAGARETGYVAVAVAAAAAVAAIAGGMVVV